MNTSSYEFIDGGRGVDPLFSILKRYFFFLEVISLGTVVVPSPKIVINLPRTYEELPCKGESYRFSG